MSELPGGWCTSALSGLADTVRGVTYNKLQAQSTAEEGLLPILRANNINSGKLVFDDLVFVPEDCVSRTQVLLAGDIVVAMSSGSRSVVGKSAQVEAPWPGSFGAFCGVLRASQEIDARYLYYFTQSRAYRDRVSELAAGVNINNLKPGHFEKISVPLAPLAEQKRIAQKLDALLAQVDTLKARIDAIPALLKRFRKSVVHSAVIGRLSADLRVPIEKSEEQEQLGPLESWREVTLASLGELSRGKSKHRPRNDSRLYGSEYPFIQTGDVANSGGALTSSKVFYSEFGLKQSRLFPSGTLCITIAANIADTAMLAIDACFPDSVVGFIPNKDDCVAQFIKYVIDDNKESLEALAPATAQKNINLKVLNQVKLRIPPIKEQTEIVRHVEQLFAYADQLEAKVAAAQQRIDALTQSLLAKAFRGELVPQDPSDEPASVLLDRIRAQRAATPKPKRGRKAATS
ncbi:restriction endonuclease subunit S [Xanthomonas oryzae]|uniref:restriction endonuclease subunit S n=2 Tax=Xanthomonas oryzae TaxID=347 RepID=UPI001E4AD1E5|nr:restriction endonuclease subunit S [Xanthomonas oryzae]